MQKKTFKFQAFVKNQKENESLLYSGKKTTEKLSKFSVKVYNGQQTF